MATSDRLPTAIVATFSCVYFLVFLLAIAGNSLVVFLCFKKRPPCPLKWFIANLAVADLSFNTLSILDIINFLWTWIGGQFSCKAQSFVIEACYNTSITTLVLISFERLQAVVEPFRARFLTTGESAHRKLIAIWVSSIIIASPLLYAYEVHVDASNAVLCTNIKFGDMGRQIYYSIHAACFFIFPLIYMIYTQRSIFLSLRSDAFTTRNALETVRTVQRHHKVAIILAALTVAFAICWSPFMVVRTLRYFHLTDDDYIWRASQLLILLNTALDPILYGIYGENFKRYLLGLFKCTKFQSSIRVENFSGREKRKRQRRDIVRVKRVSDLNVLELVDK